MNYLQIYKDYKLNEVEKKYNLEFEDKELLVRAFTHTSCTGEVNQNYERLEFLGDAVLQIIVSDFMYRHLKDLDEGEMTKTRSKIVNEVSLSKIMKQEGLDKYIRLGNSMKGSQISRGAYIADIYEAFVASIYLDQGYETANDFVKSTLIANMDSLLKDDSNRDFKTDLQEILQQNGSITIVYDTSRLENGNFKSEVKVNSVSLGQGTGSSKKLAEQQAAKKAIENHV